MSDMLESLRKTAGEGAKDIAHSAQKFQVDRGAHNSAQSHFWFRNREFSRQDPHPRSPKEKVSDLVH